VSSATSERLASPALGARYTRPAIALHWLIALLIFATIPLGIYMSDLALSPAKLRLYSYHKWIGVSVFLLACLRLAWRATHRPPLPPAMPAWQARSAALVHASLYVLIFATPLSGWLYSSAVGVPTVYFGIWQLPDLVGRDKELASILKVLHKSLVAGLSGLVIVHVAAALKHQFVERDGLLGRMWFGGRRHKGTR